MTDNSRLFELPEPDVGKILAETPDDRLAANYQRAEPGKRWREQLSEESGRRDGRGRRDSR